MLKTVAITSGGGGGGNGTVTSVSMTVPSFMSVAGSPITTSGTLAVSATTTGANSIVLRDANQNITANTFTPGWTSTTTASGTTTLTVASTYYQRFIGSTTQTVVLPSATTVALGQGFVIDNDSSGSLTLQDGAAGALGSVVPGMAAFVFCENNSTTAGSWSGYMFVPGGGPSGQVTWGTAGLSMGGQTITNSTWNGVAITNTYLANSTATLGNATITLGGTTTSVGNLTLTNATVSSGNVTITGGSINVQSTNLVSTTSSTATYGTASLPLQPLGFIQVDLNGTVVKVPYYAV